MIFGYLTIAKMISHLDAYHSTELTSKRMKNGMPNGNIIVDAKGGYNRFDAGVHRHKFDKIKCHYAVGIAGESRMLTAGRDSTLGATISHHTRFHHRSAR